MGTGYGSGDARVSKAIQDAQTSPLLNNNDIFNARKVALCISYSSECQLMMSEMDEVKEFMSRFSRDIETKHGVERDESLEDKVKITLLATGFGIQDIHMQQLDDRIKAKTEEELERLAEEEEHRRERRELYYGKEINSNSPRMRRRHIHIFTLEDLDCDELINQIENSPTYMRDKATLNSFRKLSQQQTENAVAAPLPAEDGVISFT